MSDLSTRAGGLTAATYLGDNTQAMLVTLAAALRSAGIDVRIDPEAGRSSPDALAHAADVDLVWMCGRLLAIMLRDGSLDHEVVAAPVFAGESAPVYRAVLVARLDGPGSLESALSGSVGVNEAESWSGHHGLRSFVRQTHGDVWFASELATGSHRSSIDAVRHGHCDVAGIDQTIWQAVSTESPTVVEGLAVIATTDDWPAPPFALSRRLDVSARQHITQELLGLTADGLNAIVPARADDYTVMLTD